LEQRLEGVKISPPAVATGSAVGAAIGGGEDFFSLNHKTLCLKEKGEMKKKEI